MTQKRKIGLLIIVFVALLKPVLCKDIQTPFRKNCIAVHPVLRISDMDLHI